MQATRVATATAASRYRPSARAMLDRLPEVEYDERETVRRVPASKDYIISFKGRLWQVPRASRGERLAIRPLTADGRYGVVFAAYQIASIDLAKPESVGEVSGHVSAMSPG